MHDQLSIVIGVIALCGGTWVMRIIMQYNNSQKELAKANFKAKTEEVKNEAQNKSDADLLADVLKQLK